MSSVSDFNCRVLLPINANLRHENLKAIKGDLPLIKRKREHSEICYGGL